MFCIARTAAPTPLRSKPDPTRRSVGMESFEVDAVAYQHELVVRDREALGDLVPDHV
jgi:hypothetical protein